MDLARRAQAVVANLPKDLLARTAAFLLLKDSKSSYAIEGEHAPQDRIQRWGRAIGETGRRTIDLDELLRLQAMVIGDARFCAAGASAGRPFRVNTIARLACRFHAAILAFGFVCVRPFQDGNGRIHRYLIHQVLAQRPAGVVFPVSAANTGAD